MKTHALLLATLVVATPALLAQDDKKTTEPKMPNPRHKEHDALKALAGDWETAFKCEAMPGVPGMEKAAESKGTERAELICNGLWLKTVAHGTWQGEPFEGLWIVGWDPHQKKYAGLWASSNPEPAMVMDGSYDEKTKTWTWRGKTPQGDMRSVYAFTDPDTTLETCYMKQADGKEIKCMEITRKRVKAGAVAKGGIAKDAGAKAAKDLPKESEALHKEAGEWDAAVKCTMAADQPPMEWQATETATLLCGGRFIWTDFQGQFMGAPFEGHALYGFDPVAKQYVGFWMDSMSPTHARTSGKADPAAKAYSLEGNCVDAGGKPMKIKEVVTWKDDDTRVQKMEFKGPDTTSTMEITYKRKSKR